MCLRRKLHWLLQRKDEVDLEFSHGCTIIKVIVARLIYTHYKPLLSPLTAWGILLQDAVSFSNSLGNLRSSYPLPFFTLVWFSDVLLVWKQNSLSVTEIHSKLLWLMLQTALNHHANKGYNKNYLCISKKIEFECKPWSIRGLQGSSWLHEC